MCILTSRGQEKGTQMTTTITAETGFTAENQARLDADTYGGEAGITYRATGEHAYELKSAFGSAVLVKSAARVAFEAVLADGYFPGTNWIHGFSDFDIEGLDFDGRFITATIDRKGN